MGNAPKPSGPESGGGMGGAEQASPELMAAKMVVSKVSEQAGKITDLGSAFVKLATSMAPRPDDKKQTPDADSQKEQSGTAANPVSLAPQEATPDNKPALENSGPSMSPHP